MRHAALTMIGLMLLLTATAQGAWTPNPNDKMELAVQDAILTIKERYPGMADWFNNSAGYAVFPKVGKGGFIIGGAYGKGLVIAGDAVVGETSLTEASIGFQLGGQAYSEFIFFRDATALADFQRGNYEFDAQASAVALTAGASTDASYNRGVAVFTNTTGGLMFDASVGGQKFSYTAR
jgi:lipid-binding SYLF domain-containing protein